jgi:hypothetical protein
MLSIITYGHKTLSPTPPPPTRSTGFVIFENRMLRVMLGPKREEVKDRLKIFNDDVLHHL